MSILYHWWDIGQWSKDGRQNRGLLCLCWRQHSSLSDGLVWFHAVGTTDLELVQRNKTGSNICLAIAKQIMVLFYPRKKIQQSIMTAFHSYICLEATLHEMISTRYTLLVGYYSKLIIILTTVMSKNVQVRASSSLFCGRTTPRPLQQGRGGEGWAPLHGAG